MKKRSILIALSVFLLIIFVVPKHVFATDTLISDMQNVGTMSEDSKSFKSILNTVIKLIQIAGSGISLIVVTILGTKYMVASAQDKADIKKQAIPIVIGCVLLFTASNLVGIIADIVTDAKLNT